MPGEQSAPSAGISSSVAVFLLLTSVCFFLSLSTSDSLLGQHGAIAGMHSNRLRVSSYIPEQKSITFCSYIPDIAMLCVMSIGIVVMVVFIVKQRDLTDEDGELSARHKHHRKYSLLGIVAFFIAVCILGANYIAVEVSCVDRWANCDQKEVYMVNVFELIFRIVFVLFASCEIIVCWMLESRKFKPHPWVWQGLAVVQAANVALWFDSVLEESHHRIEDDAHSFNAYFTLCNATRENRTDYDSCTEWSIAPRWFVISSPFLYPMTIEFSLLVSETFLDKVIGTNAGEGTSNSNQGNTVNALLRRFVLWFINFFSHSDNNNNNPDEGTPLVPRQSHNSSCSKMCILISGIINIVYFVISILVFVGVQLNTSRENALHLQVFSDAYTVCSVVYLLFCIICCAVGILSCQTLTCEHSHTSFLEYLLLFSTSGVLYISIKRIMAFIDNDQTSGLVSAYFITAFLDMIQALLQIVFYFYAKDVKLQLISHSGHTDGPTRLCMHVLKNILKVISISNLVLWICDSVLLPEMNTSITPSNYVIEQWPVFDNVVIPLAIFFRFNSALLFWCIGIDEPH